MSAEGGSGRPGAQRGRAGSVRSSVERIHRDSRASGELTADQELTWTIALDLAHFADVARLDGNLRAYNSTVKQLREVLRGVTGSSDGPSGDDGPSEPGDPGNGDLYGAPPEVRDPADT